MIGCWYAHKLVTFILLLVPWLGKKTLFNSLLFIFCFCLSAIMFFWLFNLCILCFLCPFNQISSTPFLHFLFCCWYLISSVFLGITLTFFGKLSLMILRNWMSSDEIKHSNLFGLGDYSWKSLNWCFLNSVIDFEKFSVFSWN